MPSIKIPYNPTQINQVLSELEQILESIKKLLLAEKLDKKQHQLKLRKLYKEIRTQLRQSEIHTKT